MALQIIGTPRSNFVRTVRMVAGEKGVPYALDPAPLEAYFDRVAARDSFKNAAP